MPRSPAGCVALRLPDRSWRAFDRILPGPRRSRDSAVAAVSKPVESGGRSRSVDDQAWIFAAPWRAQQAADRQLPHLFRLTRHLGADLHQQRGAGDRRDQQARRHSRPRARTVDLRIRRTDRGCRASRRAGGRPRRGRPHHGVAYKCGPRRAAQRHPQPHPLRLHPRLRGRRAHARRDGDRRNAALAEPAGDPLARGRQEGLALVPDRQRLCLALAVASGGEEIHRRGRRSRGRRGVRPGRRGPPRGASGAHPRRAARRRADFPYRHR